MTDTSACARFLDLVPDLATGVASGADRDWANRHIAGCASCRRALDEATAVLGELLALAPERDPPADFQSAVLRRLKPPVRRRARLRAALLTAASVVVAAALAGGVVWRTTSDDRVLAGHYRKTLTAANGQYLLAQKLHTPDGSQAGLVFAYQGRPSWIFITVRTPGPYDVWLVSRTGAHHHVGTFLSTSWGTAIDMAVHDVVEVRLNRPGVADPEGFALVAVIEVPPAPG